MGTKAKKEVQPNFVLGNTVRDIVSGFEGIATSRITYLTGCDHIGVTPNVGKKAADLNTIYIDVTRLEFVNQGVANRFAKTDFLAPEVKPGGPVKKGSDFKTI